MKELVTTQGKYKADQLGMILPHEHIFVDLGPIDQKNWKTADPDDVVKKMVPELRRARDVGVTAIVECTPVGVGRRADIVKAVSDATNFPVVVPTGIYREPWVPDWAKGAHVDEIRDWMIGELNGEIEKSGVQAGWIKLSAGDDGLTPVETKILRAAAKAGKETGAVIGSHTIKGKVVQDQLDIIEDLGYTPDRFIWIHTQADEDFNLHLEIASRGAWLEYDSIGSEWTPEEHFLKYIPQMLEAGYGNQILLSHDRGWFDPSQPNGGVPKPYTYISEVFIPKLKNLGISGETIQQLTEVNPFQAFSR